MTTLASLALAFALSQPPAEAPPAAPPAQAVLTLEEALGLAAERNLDLKAAAARLRQAQQEMRRAMAGYLPSITASGAYTLNEAESVIPEDMLFAGSPEITLLPKHQFAAQIEGRQVLFSPALWYGIKAASGGADVAELSTLGARRDVLFGTAQAFYQTASLRRGALVSERLLEIARRQENDARVRFQAGTIAKVGLLRAEIDRARAEQDLKRAQNSHESARIGLATILDRPVDFDVADPPEPTLVRDAARLEADALRDRTDVRAARRAVEAAQAGYRARLGRYFPDIAAFARWQAQNAGGFTGREHQWAAGVGLTWAILDGGLREAELRQASARVDEAQASLASVEARSRAEVRQALLELESALANAQKAKEQRDLAAENQRLVNVSYRAGAATAVEQADATAQLRNAEIAHEAETFGAQLAALRVLRVAGAELR